MADITKIDRFSHKAGDGTELWLFTGFDVNGVAAQKRPELEAQTQATLNVIPAYTWYALPSGALTFVNERTANYLGLPKDHPLRFGIDTGAEWDSHTRVLGSSARKPTLSRNAFSPKGNSVLLRESLWSTLDSAVRSEPSV